MRRAFKSWVIHGPTFILALSRSFTLSEHRYSDKFEMAFGFSNSLNNPPPPKKRVRWKWSNETCDEYGNREIIWADPPPPSNLSGNLNGLNISLRFTQHIYSYPYSPSAKLPTLPPSPILQPLRGHADVPPLDLYNNFCNTNFDPPLIPAISTPYATPPIKYSLSGVYTQQEWSLEPELGRIVVNRASRIKNVSISVSFSLSHYLGCKVTIPLCF